MAILGKEVVRTFQSFDYHHFHVVNLLMTDNHHFLHKAQGELLQVIGLQIIGNELRVQQDKGKEDSNKSKRCH